MCECVYVDLIRVYYHFATESGEVTTTKKKQQFFFFSLSVLNVKAAEVELHDPAACCECEQEQACVALKGFIRRKKTQLQFQTLNERLNMHSGHVVSG